MKKMDKIGKIGKIGKTEKLEIPNKITIGGIEYTIKVKDKFKDDNMKSWGFHNSYRAEILILSSQDNEKLAPCTILHTLLHELIHAIDAVYCDAMLSEDHVDKLEELWFGLLADNDLHIDKKGFPNIVRILGRDYEVIHDYTFESYREGNPSVSLTTSDLKIRCTREEDAPNHEVHKSNFLEVLMMHVCNPFFSKKELNGIRFHSFCSGLYQILKNSNINDLIRKWCK